MQTEYDPAGSFEKNPFGDSNRRGVYTLTVGASEDFLTDESTVYPVYIDPTLTIGSLLGYRQAE